MVLKCLAQLMGDKKGLGFTGQQTAIAAPEGNHIFGVLTYLPPADLAFSLFRTTTPDGDQAAEVGVARTVHCQ